MTKEEKDKLIELSDLNREDNVKYKSSEAQGIAIALNSDMYAPTLCKLERAYICGRRKSEKQIKELLALIKAERKRQEQCDDIHLRKIAELEKENAEAKNLIEELAFSLSVVGECDEEECELINKAQKFINKPIF